MGGRKTRSQTIPRFRPVQHLPRSYRMAMIGRASCSILMFAQASFITLSIAG
jgi:hypothetical protein